MWEFVLNIFNWEEIERIHMSSQTTADFDPDKFHGKMQQEFSTLNNCLNWKYETKVSAGSSVNVKNGLLFNLVCWKNVAHA